MYLSHKGDDTMNEIESHSLFLKQSVSGYCSEKVRKAKTKIKNLKFPDIEGISEQEMADKIYDEFKVDAPVIADLSDCTHTIPDGEIVEYHIPFSGDGELLDLSHSKPKLSEPNGLVRGSEIIVKYNLDDETRANFTENHEKINRWIDIVSKECEEYNNQLKQCIEIDLGIVYGQLKIKAKQAEKL